MVWHILKKDWKLLWRYVMLVWAVQVSFGWMQFVMDSSENRTLERILDAFGPLQLLASAFLLVAVVHQDVIPGDRQDWLIRPLKSWDLVAAKLLFALLTVNGPILVGDVVQGLAHGFSFSAVVGPASSRAIFLLIGFTFPVLVLGVLTKSFVEAVIGAIVFALGVSLFQQLVLSRSPNALQLRWSGVSWVPGLAVLVIAGLGAGVVLWQQYRQRTTLFSRGLAVGVVALCLLTQFLPWQAAFAVQQWLSPSRGMPSPIYIRFDPSLGKFHDPSGINAEGSDRRSHLFNDEATVTIHVPMRIEGLPEGAVLNADRSEVRLIDKTTKGEGGELGFGDPLLVRKKDSDNDAPVYHSLKIRRDVYDRIKNQAVRLEINYSLTLLRLAASETLPAIGGHRHLARAGSCTTRVDETETLVEVHCLKSGNLPSCLSASLEHSLSGQKNPEALFCEPDYSPFFGFADYGPDALSRRGLTLRFRYADGSVQYPVRGQQLGDSQVKFRIYSPQAHFKTNLVIPQITPGDWQAQ